MKLLFVITNVGGNSTGQVAERLLYSINNAGVDITVLCKNNNSKVDLSGVNIVLLNELLGFKRQNLLLKKIFKSKLCRRIKYYYNIILNKLINLFILIFSKDPTGFLEINFSFIKYKYIISRKTFVPDAIVSIGYGGDITSIKLGLKIAHLHNKPLDVYLTDPIPPPIGWMPDSRLRNKMKSLINDILYSVDGLSAYSSHLLDYQISLLNKKINIPLSVTNNPQLNLYNKYGVPNEPFVFLYLGDIYGKRNADTLIKAFTKIVKLYPYAELYFVGMSEMSIKKVKLDGKLHNKVRFIQWTSNVEAYLKSSFVLIDIDPDISNNIYLSGKLPFYLTVDRYILSITGDNTPARHLLVDLESAIVCHNSLEEIYNAMQRLIQLSFDESIFEDRAKVLSQFSTLSVSDKFIKHISDVNNCFMLKFN